MSENKENIIIVKCDYEGIESIIGPFSIEEARERLLRYRNVDFKATNYIPGADLLTACRTFEDDQLEHLNRILEDCRTITDEDIVKWKSRSHSDAEIEAWIRMSTPEYKKKEFGNKFCAMRLDKEGSNCICKELDLGLEEPLLMG